MVGTMISVSQIEIQESYFCKTVKVLISFQIDYDTNLQNLKEDKLLKFKR